MAEGLLQLKLTLADIRPPIWRRVFVSNKLTLQQFHQVIQAIAGWRDEHEHEFVIADERYGQPAPHEVVPVQNEVLFRLHSLPLKEGATFAYVYDFHDRWQLEIKVEKILPPDPRGPSSSVIDGARAFPPENSGGALSYEMLPVRADFDPERFDLRATNERLRLLP